jgi:hypothetical protein
MAKFTLIEQPAPGDEIPDPATNPPRIPGDDLLLIERVVVDRSGKQRGTLTVRGTIGSESRQRQRLVVIPGRH